MPALRVILIGAALCAAALPACQPVCACLYPPVMYQETVAGQVTSAGVPSAAFMNLQVLDSACAAVGRPAAGAVGQTDSNGRFVLDVETMDEGQRCVRVRARRFNGQIATDSVVVFVQVDFGAPRDTTSVEIVLP